MGESKDMLVIDGMKTRSVVLPAAKFEPFYVEQSC